MVGAIVGGFLLPTLDISLWGGLFENLVAAAFGAFILVFAIHQFKKA
ncbi:MAG: GlsB/YeaQ/YmgE family stress response membrane protein [Calditrichaceae bacterium]